MLNAYTNIVLLLHMVHKYEDDMFRKRDTFAYVGIYIIRMR